MHNYFIKVYMTQDDLDEEDAILNVVSASSKISAELEAAEMYSGAYYIFAFK